MHIILYFNDTISFIFVVEDSWCKNNTNPNIISGEPYDFRCPWEVALMTPIRKIRQFLIVEWDAYLWR